MSKNGGNLGESGSVAYMFTRTGIVLVDKGELTEDDVLMAVLDAGAEEVNDLGEKFEVVCAPTDLTAVKEALEEAGIEVDDSDQDFRASVEVPLDVEGAKKMIRLIDALEDSDDVQNVYSNMDLSDEVIAALDA
jgi:transcriptional/translational regulatory protein YebC/TACO1